MFFTQSKFNIITTTNALEGWEIKKYHEPVFSHVVAGTSIFSDFFASITDVVGFRSGTYQKQLKHINDTAIKELKKAAAEKGANCIIGLKIDHDEISGKNKSMFMVTASGTPVTAEKLQTPPDDATTRQLQTAAENEILSCADMEFAIARTDIIQRAQAGDFNFNEDEWDFILQAEIEEIIPIFAAGLETMTQESPAFSDQTKNALVLDPIKKIFIFFSPQKVTPYIYPLIENESQKTFDYIFEILKSISGVDYPRLSSIIQHDDLEIKKRALKILELNSFSCADWYGSDVEKIVDVANEMASRVW